MQVRKITYYSEGDVIVGDLYLPDDFNEDRKYPAILQCQGFTGIREMMQGEFARYFVDAGYISLAIDYRGWGDSGGERGRMAPLEQVDDCRNGLTFLETLPFVDVDRLGQYGASFGALITTYTMAIDERVKVGVAMGGVAHGYEAVTNKRTPEEMEDWKQKVAEARQRRVLYNDWDRPLKVTDVFIDDDSQNWLTEGWNLVPKWRNPLGFDSIGRIMDFRPIDIVHRIAPRPISFLLAEKDETGSPDSFRELYEAAREPKQLHTMPCGHYDWYAGDLLDQVMDKSVAFYKEHL